MSSYVCFGVEDNENNSVLIACYGRSSRLYGRISDALGWSEEKKELNAERFNSINYELDDEINECRKGLEMYDDLLKTNSSTDELFDYAKTKQEVKDTIRELQEAKQWLRFFYGLDCKKVIWFD